MFRHTFAGVSKRLRRAWLVAVLALAACSTWTHTTSAAPLTLNDALSRALSADFALPATSARVRGAEAGVSQANRLPNPALGVEVENFGGSGAYRGARSAESTLFLQQTIEFGGKRAARTGVAQSELDATRMRGALRVLDLLRDVEAAWIDTAAASAQLRVAEDRLAISESLQSEITRRAQAGRDPAYVQSRADAQVALEKIGVDQARAMARIAKTNLAGYWRGGPEYAVDLAAFERTPAAPNGKVFNVDVALLEAEREVAAARTVLERSRAISDPAVRLGVRRFSGTDDTAAIAGVAIPLPVFDANQGNIVKAEEERYAATLDAESGRRVLLRELMRLQGRLAANATEARRIQSEVIPPAERAVQQVREGLERGGFSYVEFADAQRTLNDARLRRIEALKAYHIDNATLARLTGRHNRLAQLQGSRR